MECTPIEGGPKLMLQLIDTPGLAIPVGLNKVSPQAKEALEKMAANWTGMILSYIEAQFALTLDQESKVKRNPKTPDTQVHAMLYFLSPDVIIANKGLSLLDKIALPKLCHQINVIPVLGKSVGLSTFNIRFRIWLL
jgi:septin family protein